MYAHGLCGITLSWFFSVLLEYYLASSNFYFKLFLEVSGLILSWCIFEQISNISLERTSDNQICPSSSNPFLLSGNFTHLFANNSHWGINLGIFNSYEGQWIAFLKSVHHPWQPLRPSIIISHVDYCKIPWFSPFMYFFPPPSHFPHKSQSNFISTHVWSHYFLP